MLSSDDLLRLVTTGKLYDQCQDTLVQFGTFLGSTMTVDEYVRRLPSIHSMLQDNHIHSDVAFFLARPMFAHAINVSLTPCIIFISKSTLFLIVCRINAFDWLIQDESLNLFLWIILIANFIYFCRQNTILFAKLTRITRKCLRLWNSQSMRRRHKPSWHLSLYQSDRYIHWKCGRTYRRNSWSHFGPCRCTTCTYR